MIYFSSSLDSIIESIYLDEGVSDKLGKCNIIVNPKNLNYIFGKIVIINDPNYPISDAVTLANNGCKVISRLNFEIPGIKYQPYILNINMNIMWNGEYYEPSENTIKTIYDNNLFKYNEDRKILYMPKIFPWPIDVKDEGGSLSGLGWALQQVGENIIEDTYFRDLDVIKTKKIV